MAMEQLQLETLRSLGSRFAFPPHSRRLLKSDTFGTLVRILSHCHGNSQPSHADQVADDGPKRVAGNDEVELGEATGPELGHETVSPRGLEPDILPMQMEAQSSGVIGLDDCVNEDLMEIEGLGTVNSTSDELIQDSGVKLGNLLEDGNRSGRGDVCLGNNQEHQDGNQKIGMEIDHDRREDLDKENLSSRTAEAVGPSLDIDTMVECLMVDEKDEEASSLIGQTVSEEIWPDSREWEKLLSSCGQKDLPLKVTAGEEIEEGEISDEQGSLDQPIDLLLEEAGLLENKKDDGEQIAEVIINGKPFACKEQNDVNQKDFKSNEKMLDNGTDLGSGIELEVKESNITQIMYETENINHGKNLGIKKTDDCDSDREAGRNKNQASHEYNHPEAHIRISGQKDTETQGTVSAENDSGVHKKKKRGPLTKEKREKKKRKERIKRAEKNKRLGVKRLKIQPLSKPKAVVYCRHFIKGRCHEGEKCKFSHDTIPLTKSQPCCYFARHSCMKGDDCPFDHQLSRYPCNNYVSKGYCSRGADCMFSHQAPLTKSSPKALNTTAFELKSSVLLENIGPEKQLNFHSSSSKNAEITVAEIKQAAQTPKGINKLLFGKASPYNPVGCDQAGPSAMDSGAKVGTRMIYGREDVVQTSNAIAKREDVMESKGINFLSFGKAPSHDLKSNGSSSLLSSADGIGRSMMRDISMDMRAASSPKKVVCPKVSDPIGQTATGMVPNLNRMPKKTTAMMPRGINFLSFGRAPITPQTMKGGTSLEEDKYAQPSVQDVESDSKLQIPSANPWQLPSSFPSGQHPDQLTADHGKDTPGSAPRAPLPSTSKSAQKGHLLNPAQKALLSTLSFADKYESRIKMDRADAGSDSHNETTSPSTSARGSMFLDFLYGDGRKTK